MAASFDNDGHLTNRFTKMEIDNTVPKQREHVIVTRKNMDQNVLDLILNSTEKEEDEEEKVEFTKTRLCKFFNSKRGCLKKDRCTFLHERQVCAFYASSQGCNVDNCPFIHDSSAVSKVQLKPCPNEDCTNLCIGKQCMKCHSSMPISRKRKDHRDASPEARQKTTRRSPERSYKSRSRKPVASTQFSSKPKACPEPGCRNTCLGRRCRQCHLRDTSNRQYQSDEGGFHDGK
jgi:hypothetical protein